VADAGVDERLDQSHERFAARPRFGGFGEIHDCILSPLPGLLVDWAILVLVLFLLLLLGLLLGWRTVLWRPRRLSGVTRSRPLLIGHRGVRGSLPENTVAAFRAAFEAGLDGIECDVQRTRDGVLVLLHDLEVAGCRVAELTHAELQSLAGRLCRLEELLLLAREYPGTLLNLELKSDRLRSRGLERQVATSVRRSGLVGRVLISSFDPLALARLRLLAPEFRVALLFAPDMPRWLRGGWLAGWLHVDAIHPHYRQVTPVLVGRARTRGLMVNTWTVNDPEVVGKVMSAGVDGIMADDPASLLAAVGRGRGIREDGS